MLAHSPGSKSKVLQCQEKAKASYQDVKKKSTSQEMWGIGLPLMTVTGEPKLGSVLIKGMNAEGNCKENNLQFQRLLCFVLL